MFVIVYRCILCILCTVYFYLFSYFRLSHTEGYKKKLRQADYGETKF